MKLNLGNLLLILPLAAMLTGCASPKGPPYSDVKGSGGIPQPQGNQALVMVYSHRLPHGRVFNVWANGKLVSTNMAYGQFFYFSAEPGKLHLASKMGHASGVAGLVAFDLNEINRAAQGIKDRVVFDVVAGETYYVNMHNGFTRETMDLVSKEEGEKKIQTCLWAGAEAAPPAK